MAKTSDSSERIGSLVSKLRRDQALGLTDIMTLTTTEQRLIELTKSLTDEEIRLWKAYLQTDFTLSYHYSLVDAILYNIILFPFKAMPNIQRIIGIAIKGLILLIFLIFSLVVVNGLPSLITAALCGRN